MILITKLNSRYVDGWRKYINKKGELVNEYYEPSISAYILLQKVTRSLKIFETPEVSLINGNVTKIIQGCNAIIDANEHEKETRELLKYYIARSFFYDYNLEIEDDYPGISNC